MSHGPNQPHPAMRRRSAVRQASSKSQGFFNCGESGAGSTERHARQFCIASLASTESVHRRSVALTWHNLSSLEALDLLARPRLQGGLLEAISKVSMARTRASGPALQIKKKVPSRLKASHQLIAQILAFSRVSAKHSAHVFKPAGPYQIVGRNCVFSLSSHVFCLVSLWQNQGSPHHAGFVHLSPDWCDICKLSKFERGTTMFCHTGFKLPRAYQWQPSMLAPYCLDTSGFQKGTQLPKE